MTRAAAIGAQWLPSHSKLRRGAASPRMRSLLSRTRWQRRSRRGNASMRRLPPATRPPAARRFARRLGPCLASARDSRRSGTRGRLLRRRALPAWSSPSMTTASSQRRSPPSAAEPASTRVARSPKARQARPLLWGRLLPQRTLACCRLAAGPYSAARCGSVRQALETSCRAAPPPPPTGPSARHSSRLARGAPPCGGLGERRGRRGAAAQWRWRSCTPRSGPTSGASHYCTRPSTRRSPPPACPRRRCEPSSAMSRSC
mmetsp:Transcript_25202/g.79877  ORF Transcript_25202/g.79877 Transcript_25202/m.79877 type:complete len:259 (-) Transcript_25202:1129-1905(-)